MIRKTSVSFYIFAIDFFPFYSSVNSLFVCFFPLLYCHIPSFRSLYLCINRFSHASFIFFPKVSCFPSYFSKEELKNFSSANLLSSLKFDYRYFRTTIYQSGLLYSHMFSGRKCGILHYKKSIYQYE
jgi:hypothetical protein